MLVDDSTSMSMSMSGEDKMSKQFRAAYLMVKGSVAEDLQSRQELVEALQFAGNITALGDQLIIIIFDCSRLQPDPANNPETLAGLHEESDILSVQSDH